MDIAALSALLPLLRQHGVTSFRDGDLAVTLGPEPVEFVAVEEAQGDAEDLDTPPGLLDPRKMLKAAVDRAAARALEEGRQSTWETTAGATK